MDIHYFVSYLEIFFLKTSLMRVHTLVNNTVSRRHGPLNKDHGSKHVIYPSELLVKETQRHPEVK